jgi:hypothetical protein
MKSERFRALAAAPGPSSDAQRHNERSADEDGHPEPASDSKPS